MHRDRVVTFRASAEELAELKRWANDSGMGLSEYLRSKALTRLVVTQAAGSTVTWRAS